MVLVPWRWYEELSCFAREMDQLFDRFFGRELIERSGDRVSYPRLRIIDTDDEVLLVFDIQGFSPEDIEILLERNVLVVKGEKKKGKKLKIEEMHYVQKENDSFIQTFPLQQAIDDEVISARYKNGTLTITLPKIKESPSSFRVKIK